MCKQLSLFEDVALICINIDSNEKVDLFLMLIIKLKNYVLSLNQLKSK